MKVKIYHTIINWQNKNNLKRIKFFILFNEVLVLTKKLDKSSFFSLFYYYKQEFLDASLGCFRNKLMTVYYTSHREPLEGANLKKEGKLSCHQSHISHSHS